jgi:hypothetical protein
MTDTILLTVPSGPRGAGVVSLLLGGLGTRLDLPVDRIDELGLAVAAVGARTAAESLQIEVSVSDDRLLVSVGPLEDGVTGDPARRRVVESLVDGFAASRRDGHEWCELEVRRGVAG